MYAPSQNVMVPYHACVQACVPVLVSQARTRAHICTHTNTTNICRAAASAHHVFATLNLAQLLLGERGNLVDGNATEAVERLTVLCEEATPTADCMLMLARCMHSMAACMSHLHAWIRSCYVYDASYEASIDPEPKVIWIHPL